MNCSPAASTGKPEVFLMENDTHVPYSDQWNLGVRQTFGNDRRAPLSYANIRSYHGLSFLWGAGSCCPRSIRLQQRADLLG